MVITPQTNIKLLKVPFEMDNLNQLTFSNATAQYNYFNGLSGKLEYDDCTYQRKEGYMAIPENADTLQPYNYCMYQNEQYGNKWFYAFITNITYESNRVSYVYIKTDVFQTWQFDIVWKRSFVEREHTNDDTIGANTVPEGLELGEYIINYKEKINLCTSFYIGMSVTELPHGLGSDTRADYGTGKYYGGVYSGSTYIVARNIDEAGNILAYYNKAGKIDSIVAIFMIPTNLVTISSWITESSWSWTLEYGLVAQSTSPIGFSVIMNTRKPTSLNGYTPINKKLLVYPYQYLNVDNNYGIVCTYHFEDFVTNALNSISFNVDSTIVPGMSIKVCPAGYKNSETDNDIEGFMLGKLPICSYQNDIYKNWLRQNAINIGLSVVGSAGQVIAGSAMLSSGVTSLAGAGSIASGLHGITSTIGQAIEHSIIPNQAEGNINGSDVNFAKGLYNPMCYYMCIKNEYAQIIDNFFSMYGYKTNRLKLPNRTGRTNWNYVKTVGCNITGDIPQKDLQELKSMFDNGVTLWHNASTFLDYSQSNTII